MNELALSLYNLPSRLRRKLKQALVRRSFARCGRNFRFDPDSTFINPHLMEFGDDVFIGPGAHFATSQGLSIGSGVMFGPFPTIIGGDHNFAVVGRRMCDVHTGGVNLTTFVADDVWFGARVTILKGVRIGEGTVVGAGSLVVKDLPPYAVAVGSPCRVTRARFNKGDLERHLQAVESKWSLEEVLREWAKFGVTEPEA